MDCPHPKTTDTMNANYVVNIGRQLGSGGREIGKELAARLGIGFYDKELLTIAAQESGLCREFFERADERTSQGFVSGLLGMRFSYVGDGMLPTQNCLSNDSLFKVQSDVIRRLAAEGSCLFVGRCADYILREHPHCVNIFVSAPKEIRAERICQRHGISLAEAMRRIDKADKTRAEYYDYYSCNAWGVASTYHLCIDSSVLGIAGTVDFLYAYVHKSLATV